MRIAQATIYMLAALAPASALASETVTYSYDAKGRLVTVNHTGSVNTGLSATYGYDAADNRTNTTVSGAHGRVIVVPLGGLTVMSIR